MTLPPPNGSSPGPLHRITLVINSLGAGGAERVMSMMAGWWATSGVSVTLITLTPRERDFYSLDSRVTRVALDLSRPSSGAVDALRSNLARVRALRRAIAHSCPDVVISFMDVTNVLTLLATLGLGVPVIVSERIDPRRYPIGRFWSTLRRWVYPCAEALVVQAEALRSWGEQHLPKSRLHVIPNPVAAPAATPQDKGSAPQHPTVIAMGRLTAQKGFDLLIEAFARCAPDFPDWDLLILGEGEERKKLEHQARELGVSARVHLPGRVPHPEEHLAKAELFVLSSRYEGFPNALVEAMSCGLAAISTDCPTGPAEIIRPGVDGLLVPAESPEALEKAMRNLMSDPAERRRLAERAPEVITRFGVARVMEMWNNVSRQVVRTKHGRSDNQVL